MSTFSADFKFGNAQFLFSKCFEYFKKANVFKNELQSKGSMYSLAKQAYIYIINKRNTNSHNIFILPANNLNAHWTHLKKQWSAFLI